MESHAALTTLRLPVLHYHLDATLDSGQAFRWRRAGEAWEGVVEGRYVKVRATPQALRVSVTPTQPGTAQWLRRYFQTEIDLASILETFPEDALLRRAHQAYPGLRLLRQEPWETLVSFILSSAKQIPHIRDLVERLAQHYGAPVPGHPQWRAFPTPASLAAVSVDQLRALGLGYRAAYVAEAARQVDARQVDLESLHTAPMEEACARLMSLPGVGVKIAQCVLLFAYGFQAAFPVDTWIRKALEKGYPGRFPGPAKQLETQILEHFGPHAGYAQQYLFHAIRNGAVSLPD